MEPSEIHDMIVTKKLNMNKVLIVITIAVVVIASSVTAGIIVSNKRKEKMLASMVQENAQTESNMQTEEENPQNDTQENISQGESNVGEGNQSQNQNIPVYSENAKNKIKNMYAPDENGKVAYLTFDDGPSDKITPQILDILKEQNIKATFFVLGSRAELYPELVKREYEEGHFIANHGYSHVYTSVYASPQAVLDEYNHTDRIIKDALGKEEYSGHLFRFPGGSEGGKYANVKNDAKKILEENNVSYINWNCLTNDAVGKPTHDSIINDLKSTSNGKERLVVLMHDTNAKQLTVDTLLENINYLRDQGYVFKNFYDIMK